MLVLGPICYYGVANEQFPIHALTGFVRSICGNSGNDSERAKVKAFRGMGRPRLALGWEVVRQHPDSWWGKRCAGILEDAIEGSVGRQSWIETRRTKQVKSKFCLR